VALDPVSPFLALIDRLISLIKEREMTRKEYFEKIIAPLYESFSQVGGDYIALFRQARSLLETLSATADYETAFLTIRDRREQLLEARTELRAFAKAYREGAEKKGGEETTRFLASMLQFFYASELMTELRQPGFHWRKVFAEQEAASRYISSIAFALVLQFQELRMCRLQPSEYLVQQARTFIDGSLAGLETTWSEIALLFADMKMKAYANSRPL